MLTRPQILGLFRALNKELQSAGVIGEAGICGGAVMCLVFKARSATKDIDAVFHPTREMRAAVKKVAAKFALPQDWLNDAVKGYFHTEPPQVDILKFSNLRVWAPKPDYLLAMKCIAARFDTADRGDAQFLIKYLELKTPSEVFAIIERYYPDRLIPPNTKFFVEEILT